MSIQYDKEILSNENLKLKINFFGINDDIANAADLKMSVYAFAKDGEPKFSEILDFGQIKSLYDHLNQISIIRNSILPTTSKFIESTAEINDLLIKLHNVNPDTLKIVLSKLKEEDKIKALFEFLSEYEIDALASSQRFQLWKVEIENLKKIIAFEEAGKVVEETNKDLSLAAYHGKQPEKIFQNWIEKNHLWIFGIDYLKKHDARKIALYSEGDMLMESIDGYLDLIELKRPSHPIFSTIDASHKSYYPSTDLSKVMGQCLFYLQKMDDFKVNLEKEYKVKIIRPRIKIIIGRTKDFNDDQYNALRMLNCQLTHIEIISYDTLLKYGEKMIAHYE
jgi:Domain of unknown function (DUF4263)